MKWSSFFETEDKKESDLIKSYRGLVFELLESLRAMVVIHHPTFVEKRAGKGEPFSDEDAKLAMARAVALISYIDKFLDEGDKPEEKDED